ncbi:hypothetical protein ACET3Z_003047 [Daucus carota]
MAGKDGAKPVKAFRVTYDSAKKTKVSPNSSARVAATVSTSCGEGRDEKEIQSKNLEGASSVTAENLAVSDSVVGDQVTYDSAKKTKVSPNSGARVAATVSTSCGEGRDEKEIQSKNLEGASSVTAEILAVSDSVVGDQFAIVQLDDGVQGSNDFEENDIDPEIKPSHPALPISSTSSSYQQYMVPNPVYGMPVVPTARRERSVGVFGCVFNVGKLLVRFACPCFRITEAY